MNVASRLESSGVSGRIQVSEQAAQILSRHGQFEVECRGPIDVKGKGRLTTYLVVTPYDGIEYSDQESQPGDGCELNLASEKVVDQIPEYGEPEPPPTTETDDKVLDLEGQSSKKSSSSASDADSV